MGRIRHEQISHNHMQFYVKLEMCQLPLSAAEEFDVSRNLMRTSWHITLTFSWASRVEFSEVGHILIVKEG